MSAYKSPVYMVNVCFCSGSMRDHLPLLKETLKFMVQQLRADDRLSLISFDNEVSYEIEIFNVWY